MNHNNCIEIGFIVQSLIIANQYVDINLDKLELCCQTVLYKIVSLAYLRRWRRRGVGVVLDARRRRQC